MLKNKNINKYFYTAFVKNLFRMNNKIRILGINHNGHYIICHFQYLLHFLILNVRGTNENGISLAHYYNGK